MTWSELRDIDTAAMWHVSNATALIDRAGSRALAGWAMADQVLPDV